MKIFEILDKQTKNIDSATFILGFAFLLSAILGFTRDHLLASAFGAGDELDIYYTAFRIPDFITWVMIMGAISAAIIPVFSNYLVRSKDQAFEYLANLLNLFLIILIIICSIMFIFAPHLISFIASGFPEEKKILTVILTRIMFLSPILLGISSIISGILKIFRRFLITALCPIVYNLGIIFGILVFVPLFGIQGLAWGVALGAGCHLLIQVPVLLKLKFKPKKILNFFEPGFIKTIKLTIPRSIGLAATQINFIVITIIASNLPKGSLSIFNLAENLSRPILSLIAVSFSTAAFPVLSLSFSKNNKQKFNQIFSSTFYKIFLISSFLSILLFIFRQQIVDIIYKSGKFGTADANLTAACLGMFCIGIFAQSLIILLVKVFYAKQNTKIPALTSIVGVFINIGLCLVFIHLLSFSNPFYQGVVNFSNIQNLTNIKVLGLALALSISSICQLCLLLIFLKNLVTK